MWMKGLSELELSESILDWIVVDFTFNLMKDLLYKEQYPIKTI